MGTTGEPSHTISCCQLNRARKTAIGGRSMSYDAVSGRKGGRGVGFEDIEVMIMSPLINGPIVFAERS